MIDGMRDYKMKLEDEKKRLYERVNKYMKLSLEQGRIEELVTGDDKKIPEMLCKLYKSMALDAFEDYYAFKEISNA